MGKKKRAASKSRNTPGKDVGSFRLNKSVILILIIFLAAFLPRLFYTFEVRELPFFRTPIIDAKAYDTTAQKIAGGEWIGESSFWQPPFYPYYLAVQYRIFGHNLLIVRIIQNLLGALSCILIYLIAGNIFNRRTGILAAILGLANGVLIYYEGELLITTLYIFLTLVLILPGTVV